MLLGLASTFRCLMLILSFTLTSVGQGIRSFTSPSETLLKRRSPTRVKGIMVVQQPTPCSRTPTRRKALIMSWSARQQGLQVVESPPEGVKVTLLTLTYRPTMQFGSKEPRLVRTSFDAPLPYPGPCESYNNPVPTPFPWPYPYPYLQSRHDITDPETYK